MMRSLQPLSVLPTKMCGKKISGRKTQTAILRNTTNIHQPERLRQG